MLKGKKNLQINKSRRCDMRNCDLIERIFIVYLRSYLEHEVFIMKTNSSMTIQRIVNDGTSINSK